MSEEEPEFETGEKFSLGMEEPETEEEPIPETEEEPEENFTRSGGRRASNLGRNREVASKQIPQGNVLVENKLQESINIDKFLLDVEDIEYETMSIIGTDEGVENHYADGYKAGIDMIKIIADEDRQFPDDLVSDIEKKQSEIYTDYESLEDEEAQRMGIDDDYCEGWYQAFEDVLEKFGAGTITPDKKEESKLTEAPTEEDEEFKKLCSEIWFQADENDFTLTDEDVKGIAKKMIADKFFFNHDIFADEDDEEAWEEINDLIVSAIEAYPNKVDESKEIKKEAKGFITVGNKKYGINSALTMINNIYDILYDSEKELDNIFPFGIGTYTDEGDKLIKEKDPQVTKLISARGDAFTSDREATALGMFFSGLTKEALTSMLISNASKTESKQLKIEGSRDVDRENDKWYLNMGMLQSLSDMDDSQIKHYATWQEYNEIYDIIEADDDTDTKLQKLKELRDSIDYKIKFAVDYADTTQEAIDKWLKYYKDYIDGYIKALSIGDKYYIEIYGRYNVDYNGEPDDEPFGFTIKIENGKFEKGTKYYDTEEEAKADMKTISKDDITKYLKNIYGDTLWEWQIGVNKVSLDRVANGQLEESKEIKTEKKIVIDNMGETYTIDTDAKTYTVKTANGEKTFTFDEMNDFVKQARGANRIYKPYSLLAYTDFKNGNLKNWEVKQDLNDEGVYNTLEQKLNKIVQDELGGDPKYSVGKFDILNGDNTVGTAIGIITEYDGTKYGIGMNANDWTLTHIDSGRKVKSFDTYQEAINALPDMNEAIKAMPEKVAEFTKQFNNLKSGKKTEAVESTADSVVFTLDLKGEPEDISGGFESVDICIKGTNTLTTMIKKAITSRFAGIFKSDITGKVYSQDIPVADDLWLTFLDFDEATNTLNFVLDGDVSKDKELVDNKKEESVTSKEYDDILLAIDQADSMEELQDIIYAVTDGVVEDEMQSMLDACIKDNDDLDTVKDMLTAIFEDNTDIEE